MALGVRFLCFLAQFITFNLKPMLQTYLTKPYGITSQKTANLMCQVTVRETKDRVGRPDEKWCTNSVEKGWTKVRVLMVSRMTLEKALSWMN